MFADAIAADLIAELPAPGPPIGQREVPAWIADPTHREDVQGAMSQGAGVLRSATTLADTAACLAKVADRKAAGVAAGVHAGVESWEMTNLLSVGAAITAAAVLREETRGSHWREDFRQPVERWRGHLLTTLSATGDLQPTFEPLR